MMAFITWAKRLKRRRHFIILEVGGHLLLEDGVSILKLE